MASQTPQVLFVRLGEPGLEWQTISALCDLYGLTCGRCSPEDAAVELGPSAMPGQDVLAVIVEASSLDPAAALWRSLRDAHVPILVLSTRPSMPAVPDPNQPGGVVDLKFVSLKTRLLSWQITQADRQVTRELTAVSARIRSQARSSTIIIDPASLGGRIDRLLLVRSADGESHLVCGKLKALDGPVFLAGFSHPVQDGAHVFEPGGEANLISVIPILTFLRFAGGSRCWHRDLDYANLTIDDPWLTEPYGCLSYQSLLGQMKKARFHTTVAFIPWNFDKSDDDVAAIFRAHPEHFSICVHGNNHDRWEFYKYRTMARDPLPAKPLHIHEANIRQGLARMDRFRQLTGVDFDQVMVFPHYVPPLRTFSLLKRYNFLMTTNGTNVPLDVRAPRDLAFQLRPITTRFANFASMTRHSPDERSQVAVALDLFLDNPVIFSAHHTLFHEGTDAFNWTADMVNTLQPDTKWVGLGDMARRCYLLRNRPDGNVDLKAFCRSIDLANDQLRGRTYFVEKAETSDVPIRQVLVDGIAHPYVISDGRLQLALTVAPYQSRRVDIQYEDSFQAAKVDISRNDSRVNRLRVFSDLRDCTLLQHAPTRFMVDFYYASRLCKLGPKGAATLGCILLAATATSGWRLLRLVGRRSGARLKQLTTE